MKLAAFILLVSFIGYFGETIKIPLSFSESYKKTMCCSKMMKERCMKKHQADKSRKCNPKDCNTSCANCPLNSVTIFEYYSTDLNTNIFCKKEYPFIRSSLSSDYIPDKWKPPNIILV